MPRVHVLCQAKALPNYVVHDSSTIARNRHIRVTADGPESTLKPDRTPGVTAV